MSDEIKEYLEPGKKNLILIYILYLCGLFVPILPFIGAVFSFANKNNANNIWRSHYIFAFRTFCFGTLGVFIVVIMPVVFIVPILRFYIYLVYCSYYCCDAIFV